LVLYHVERKFVKVLNITIILSSLTESKMWAIFVEEREYDEGGANGFIPGSPN